MLEKLEDVRLLSVAKCLKQWVTHVLKIWKSWWKTWLQFILCNIDGKETKHRHFRMSMNFCGDFRENADSPWQNWYMAYHLLIIINHSYLSVQNVWGQTFFWVIPSSIMSRSPAFCQQFPVPLTLRSPWLGGSRELHDHPRRSTVSEDGYPGIPEAQEKAPVQLQSPILQLFPFLLWQIP